MKFRFRARAGGRTRIGQIEAQHRAHAERLLRERGLEVCQLEPRREYRPTWGDRLAKLAPEGRRRPITVALLIMGLGLLVWTPGPRPSEPDRAQPSWGKTRLSVVGQFPAGLDPARVHLKVSFPELPLRREYAAAKVVDRSGRLHLEIEVMTRRSPGFCNLELTDPQKGPSRAARILPQGDPPVYEAHFGP